MSVPIYVNMSAIRPFERLLYLRRFVKGLLFLCPFSVLLLSCTHTPPGLQICTQNELEDNSAFRIYQDDEIAIISVIRPRKVGSIGLYIINQLEQGKNIYIKPSTISIRWKERFDADKIEKGQFSPFEKFENNIVLKPGKLLRIPIPVFSGPPKQSSRTVRMSFKYAISGKEMEMPYLEVHNEAAPGKVQY